MSLVQQSITKLKFQVCNADVSNWQGDCITKLTVDQVFQRFGVDIENDRRNAFFWRAEIDKTVMVTEELLDWIGYSGRTYSEKKHGMQYLLKKNNNIQFDEISDDRGSRKKYYVMTAIDFEAILMQMQTKKASELRHLFSLMKMIVLKYREYEQWFERYSAEGIRQRNSVLLASLNDLTNLIHSVKQQVAEERQRADERERKAEEERQRAEERERKAEGERKLAEERNKQLTSQIEINVQKLRNDIAPHVAPHPINFAKCHRVGLFRLPLHGEWYLMRRQREAWNDGERRLVKRKMILVGLWENVPHAVDLGNSLKQRCRGLSWYANGNILRVQEDQLNSSTEDVIIGLINDIVNQENMALVLANDNIKFLYKQKNVHNQVNKITIINL